MSFTFEKLGDRLSKAGNAIWNIPGNVYNAFDEAWGDGEDLVTLTPQSGTNKTYDGKTVDGYSEDGTWQGNINPVTNAYANNESDGSILAGTKNESNPGVSDVTGFDSANFNVQDTNQVLELQKMLGLKEDGIFGPETEKAYRNMVNQQRTAAGQDAYIYGNDNMASLAMENNEEPVQEEQSWYQKYGPKNPMTGEPILSGTGGGQTAFERNQAKRDEMEAKRQAMLADRYDSNYTRARDRYDAGKKVWNKKMRDIIAEEEANQNTLANPYR